MTRDLTKAMSFVQTSPQAVAEAAYRGMHTMFLPPEKRDASIAGKALETLKKPIAVLDQALEKSGHLVGERFTAADLNVGVFVAYLASAREFLTQYPRVAKFVGDIVSRPAFKKAMPARG